MRPAEVELAMRLVLSVGGAPVEVHFAQEFITFAQDRGIDLSAIQVAHRQGKLYSAILPVMSPGKTALLLCPGGIGGTELEPATRELIRPVCQLCASHHVHLAQCLVDPADLALQQLFASQGFLRLAELHYLQVQPPAGSPPDLSPGQSWVTYSPESHGLFGRTILESYRGSLDCPALNGLRDVEDILAGHKASGIFNPDNWRVLQENDRPRAVLLLSEAMRGDALELVYLGIVPEARGKGLGEFMMRQALATTAMGNHGRLCLAVDSQNVPALKLYYRHGMQRIGSKQAMLRDLRSAR